METELLPLNVEWEGIPADTKTFTNQVFEEDLFSLGELQSASSGPTHAEEEEDDFDDEEE